MQTNTTIIRRAVTADITAIMAIVKEVVPLMRASGNFQWSDDYPNPEVFDNDIRLNQLWVAEIDGQVAGMSAITQDQSPEYAEVGWDINAPAIVTHRLAVSPRFRGNGIAEALLSKAEDVAREKAISTLLIDTNSNNQATQRLFPKVGYAFAGEIGLEFRPGLRFYCYKKSLL